MTHENTFRLASDIGGTFTDTVLIDANDKVVATTKTPTTPRAPARGALLGALLSLPYAPLANKSLTSRGVTR